jgi:hypothetical protein
MTQQVERKIGLRKTVALMLSLAWPDSSVSRATVRAALPQGDTGHLALRGFLGDFAYKNGHATGGRYFIHVLQPDALREYAFGGLPPTTTIYDFVHLPTVVANIRRQIYGEPNPAIRRRREAEADLLESLW